jgi:hypothetical protein
VFGGGLYPRHANYGFVCLFKQRSILPDLWLSQQVIVNNLLVLAAIAFSLEFISLGIDKVSSNLEISLGDR